MRGQGLPGNLWRKTRRTVAPTSAWNWPCCRKGRWRNRRSYSKGVARFGRAAAVEAGAVKGIRSLIARGIQVETAREVLATH